MDDLDKRELIEGIAHENNKLTQNLQSLFLSNVEELRTIFETHTKENYDSIKCLGENISSLEDRVSRFERKQAVMDNTLRVNIKKIERIDDETELRILLKYKSLLWVLTIGSIVLLLIQVIPSVTKLLKLIP